MYLWSVGSGLAHMRGVKSCSGKVQKRDLRDENFGV